MLSKSQARLFFIGGTLLFSVLFLFLTVDTVRQVPDRTNAENITKEVVHGRELWDSNNCMGCHTLFGEGAYYAPELTQVVNKKFSGNQMALAGWLMAYRNVEGRRKMVEFNFSFEEASSLAAFLEWAGKVDLNGFPAEPTPNLIKKENS